jgi:hypothetical protein
MTALPPEAEDAVVGIPATEIADGVEQASVRFTAVPAAGPFREHYRLDIHRETKPRDVGVILTSDAAKRLLRTLLSVPELRTYAAQSVAYGT